MRTSWGLLFLCIFSCGEEKPTLSFREPTRVQSEPSTTPQPEPTSIIASQPASVPASQSSNFSCKIGGQPWVLSPTQKLQGLLLERPSLVKEQPPTKLITISLQSATNERLLIEIVADTPKLESAKLTLTTKTNVFKTSTSLVDLSREDAPESFSLSFRLETNLQPLGSTAQLPVEDCLLKGVVIRSLHAETEAPDD